MVIDKLEEVDIRELWKHEQYDFSERLSKKENIENLNYILGLMLDWRSFNNSKASKIVTFIKDLNFDDHSNYNNLMNKTIDLAVLMRDTFNIYILIIYKKSKI